MGRPHLLAAECAFSCCDVGFSCVCGYCRVKGKGGLIEVGRKAL